MFLESKLASLVGTNLTIEDTGIRLPLSLDFKAGLLLLRETLLTASTPLSSPQATPMVPRNTESASPIFRNAPPPMLSAIVPTVTTSAGFNSALELTTTLATQSAEENTTAMLANHNIEQLQDGLTQAGFHAVALHCQQGKPPHIMPIDTLLTGAISLLDTHA